MEGFHGEVTAKPRHMSGWPGEKQHPDTCRWTFRIFFKLRIFQFIRGRNTWLAHLCEIFCF